MTTGHPLGDFLHGLLNPCEKQNQLVFSEQDIPSIRARFLKEAHGLEPEVASDVVLSAIGILNQAGQFHAARQLLRLYVETVKSLETNFNKTKYREFQGQVRCFEPSEGICPEKPVKKPKDIIPLDLPIRS